MMLTAVFLITMLLMFILAFGVFILTSITADVCVQPDVSQATR